MVNILNQKGFNLDEINWKIMMPSPKLLVPKQEKTLFVLKSLKKYEPFKNAGIKEHFCKWKT